MTLGNEEEIDSLVQIMRKGDRVETWFKAQYNKPKNETIQGDKEMMCYKLDCQCDCDLEHKKCRQTACDWRIERMLNE